MRGSAVYRFGDFELDVAGYQLRRAGRPIKLERRPMDLLILLAERRGELVSRRDIVERLWGSGVFVDAEMGVNTAIRKVRQALGDGPESPAFIETVAGKGYRFIGAGEPGVETPLDGQPASDRPATTIAVLPFENLSTVAEHEYLADGFTEEATTALGQIDPAHLRVIGRTSVLTYKRTRKSLAEIGAELGATYLIEGSLRSEGRRWRITTRLIRVAGQMQVWSASFDSEPSSMLEFQRDLSRAIAESIRVHLSPEHLTALGRRLSRNPDAYDLYLRGRHLWHQFTPDGNRRAIDCYARATELDPEYALAWSGVTDAFAGSPINADASPFEVGPRARDAAARAVASGPDIAETQTSFGLVKFWLDWDWAGAEAAFRRAIALDPGYSFAHRMLGVLLGATGRYRDAQGAMRRARELDPLQPMNYALSAHVALLARDYAAGRELADQAIAIAPSFWIGYFQLAWACERLGDSDAALQALSPRDPSFPGNSKMIALRGYILAVTGRRDDAVQVVRTLTAIARERFVPPYAIALVHAGLGDRDQAFAMLEHAYKVRDVHLIWLQDSRWDRFRSDPRFTSLIERCGLTAFMPGSAATRRRSGPTPTRSGG